MTEPTPPPEAPEKRSFVWGLLMDWAIALVVVLVVVAGWNTFVVPSAPKGVAPDFVLNDLNGVEHTLAQLSEEHEVVVLNFWFTSCPPCRKEIPELSNFAINHPEVPMIGISTDRGMDLAKLKSLSGRLGVKYPVLHDHDVSVARSYGINTFPTTLVLAHQEILAAKVGIVDEAWLVEAVNSHKH